MSFLLREEVRDGQTLDCLTSDSSGLRIIVARQGAELISLQRRAPSGEWRGFLYRDDEITKPARGWENHATVMGYFLHRLKNGRSNYRGQEIVSGNHGFLRHREWHRVESTEDALTYEITRADFTPQDYPLNVSLNLSYQLEGDALRVTFCFRNHEPELTAHVGFGLHPGFAARAFESFEFQMPAGRYRRHLLHESLLSGETRDFDFAGGAMPFAREELPGSYILELLELQHAEFTFLDAPSKRAVDLDMAGVPYLTLWSDGGPFLCVEPCWGLTNHFQQRAFEEKEGIQQIVPGGELRASFRMTPSLTS